MRRSVIRAGYFLMALGLLLLTPIADLSPVGVFAGNSPGYYKIVPVWGTEIPAMVNLPVVVLLCTGVLLVLSGKFYRANKER